MRFKTCTKLYILLIFFVLSFASCVNNGDEPDPTPTPEADIVPLTKENIEGTWELYFYNKIIVLSSLNISKTYRFTENDGFTVTFQPNGVYYESNVFDMETIRGKYEFKKGAPNKGDSIKFDFPSPKTGKDTATVAHIPYLYDNRFVYQHFYNGTQQGHHFYIADTKYYRHMVRGAGYYPSHLPDFNKTIVDENKLLGVWKLLKLQTRYDSEWLAETDEDRAEYGTLFMFYIENGKRMFKEVKPGESIANRAGEFKVVDDVIHMFHWITDATTGEKTTKSFKFWIRQSLNNDELIIDGDIYRSTDNVLVEVETKAYYSKIQ